VRAFADAVKYSIAAAFGIPQDQAIDFCNDLKRPGSTVSTHLAYPEERDPVAQSGRDFIRQYAESHKKLYGEDFWARQLFPSSRMWDRWLLPNGERPEIAVVSDLRFAVEWDCLSQYKCEVWGIKDRGNPDSPTDFDPDNVDHWIYNGGSLDGLRDQINTLL
jgi:hypothetical protein